MVRIALQQLTMVLLRIFAAVLSRISVYSECLTTTDDGFCCESMRQFCRESFTVNSVKRMSSHKLPSEAVLWMTQNYRHSKFKQLPKRYNKQHRMIVVSSESFTLKRKMRIYPRCLRQFSFRAFYCFAFLELSTRSVHCAPGENDRPSEQTKRLSHYRSMLYQIFNFW